MISIHVPYYLPVACICKLLHAYVCTFMQIAMSSLVHAWLAWKLTSVSKVANSNLAT